MSYLTLQSAPSTIMQSSGSLPIEVAPTSRLFSTSSLTTEQRSTMTCPDWILWTFLQKHGQCMHVSKGEQGSTYGCALDGLDGGHTFNPSRWNMRDRVKRIVMTNSDVDLGTSSTPNLLILFATQLTSWYNPHARQGQFYGLYGVSLTHSTCNPTRRTKHFTAKAYPSEP